MKDIAITPEGNRIVEMSKSEYIQLSALARAVEGSPLPFDVQMNPYEFRSAFDFTKTFEVIRAWYTMKFRLNELKEYLNEIESGLERIGNG